MMARKINQTSVAGGVLTPPQIGLLGELWERAAGGSDEVAAAELADFLWRVPGGARASYAVRFEAWPQAEGFVRELVQGAASKSMRGR